MATVSTVTAEVKMVDNVDQAAAMLNPLRLRLLRELEREDTASGLARKLNMARQKLNYHLKELERHGLIELVEERRKGNCIERVVRAVARSYLISPSALRSAAADPDRVEDRLSSAYLVAVSARAIQELSVLRARADKAGKKLATLTLQADVRFRSAARQSEFAAKLADALAALAARYHDEKSPKGRLFRFFVGGYPAVTRNDEDQSSSEPESRK